MALKILFYFSRYWDGYQCGRCGEEFNTKEQLRNHIRGIHGGILGVEINLVSVDGSEDCGK